MGPGELIERAAVELLDAHGLEGVTVRAIAARAHYHRSTVMYHIESVTRLRESMWRAIAVEMIDDLFPADAVDPRDDAWVGRTVRRLLQHWRARPNQVDFFASYVYVYGTPDVLDPSVIEALFPGVARELAEPAAAYALGLLAALTRLLPVLPDAASGAVALGALLDATRGELGAVFGSQ